MSDFISQRGLRWHYRSFGEGELLVFIHGFGGSSRLWHAQQDYFSKGFRTVAVDLPGHGESGWMPLSINELAKDLIELIDHLGGEHINLTASSLGGLIAMDIYRQAPFLVMRMSLAGSIPKFARGDNYPAGLDIDKIRTLSRQFTGEYAAVLDMFFRSLFTMKERNSPRFKDLKQLRGQEPLPNPEALQHFLKILEDTDQRDRISRMTCPMQFITGSDDYICPPLVMEWMAEHMHNARFDVIKDSGHLPFLIEVEEYNRLLEDFLVH